MELKSLTLGLALSIGIFAVKCGAGLSYLLAAKIGKIKLRLALTLFVGSYCLLFAVAWLMVERLRFFDHLDLVLNIAQSGMVLHIFFALGLLVWGMVLLSKNDASNKSFSHGWVLLVVPCPICFSAIFCSVAFFLALFPGKNGAIFGLVGFFFAVSLFTATALYFLATKFNAERFLGWIMVFIALYFFLTITLVPQFSDIDRIYRLSFNRDSVPLGGLSGNTSVVYVTVILAGLGFLVGIFKKHLVKLCK